MKICFFEKIYLQYFNFGLVAVALPTSKILFFDRRRVGMSNISDFRRALGVLGFVAVLAWIGGLCYFFFTQYSLQVDAESQSSLLNGLGVMSFVFWLMLSAWMSWRMAGDKDTEWLPEVTISLFVITVLLLGFPFSRGGEEGYGHVLTTLVTYGLPLVSIFQFFYEWLES